MESPTATVLQINARSLKTIDANKNKMVQFKSLVALKEAHIITVCESWLNPSIEDKDILSNNDFQIYRKDRHDREGGGVFIAVTNSITSSDLKALESPDPDHNEIVAVELIDHLKSRHALICAYKPPDENNFDFANNLYTCIQNV